MTDIDLEGRVAVVTGGGGGLGRSHALLLASRGASVVVNDVADRPDGPAAEAVTKEILDAGGRAVANRESVADADAAASVVADALGAFGHIDIVVNNAGIIRDRSFANGYLTLALLIPMMEELLEIPDRGLAINYGLDRVRLTAPVPVDSRVRARARLLDAERRGDGVRYRVEATVEVEGKDRPALVATAHYLAYPHDAS